MSSIMVYGRRSSRAQNAGIVRDIVTKTMKEMSSWGYF